MTEHLQKSITQLEIPKAYDPKQIEPKWYSIWEKNGYFQPNEKGSPYCIVIPPPNVTGYLHMGHALQHTVMDVLVRWKRMQGHKTLWLPGTDHAGIATQMVVEKQLNSKGINRIDLGRESFEKKIWEWREHSGGTIQKQMRLEGISVDWTRERFTLDEGLSIAVREAFVRLYNDGLIYRGAYMVNWSPKLNTAISDLEVEMKEVAGFLYHIKYPIVNSSEFITVATTRPETLLGDTGIAIHPMDERYINLQGKRAIVPLVNREIPFITDEIVEKDFGTGAVKVTPAHDPNDFEMGKRHNLDLITVIGKDARMTDSAGPEFVGLDRYVAREKIVQKLTEEGYLIKIEEYTHKVGHCQRSGVPIEPLISDQWFLNVKSMANVAIQAVKDGQTKFIPENWEKIFFDWLENIRPWCISRQLWWGHRIPAWYTEDGKIIVANSEDEARSQLQDPTQHLRQDEDVLDTWFSSALWPFSTLGWPAETKDLKTFYPTTVLVTGFDIIFFWVARMMMFGLHFMKEVPFKTVYITGLVRDAHGQKMSKTKGNVIDPLEVFVKYGTDAVRFALASAVTGGNDIKLQENKMESSRNFVNKIWNATRFVLMNLDEEDFGSDLNLDSVHFLADRWIISRLNKTALEINSALENYRFYDAAQSIYHFFWDDFCDWYIELSKSAVTSKEITPQVRKARGLIISVLEQSLRLLHPIMPFITEELWQRLYTKSINQQSISISSFPKGNQNNIDEEAIKGMNSFIEVITRVRNIRSEMSIAPRIGLTLHITTENKILANLLEDNKNSIKKLANIEKLYISNELASIGFSAKVVLSEMELAVPLEGLIDQEKEKNRLIREISKLKSENEKIETQLNAPSFMDRAPQDIISEKKVRSEELLLQIDKLNKTLSIIIGN